ncbi:MAG: division/cell wall cluster transcriptional repressor MraZ [Oscillospiraceae bacterium]|nr:MAG: division/cell wall cluster transcriptional repressor MraZ [Oscillospiraceae bacterium]
MQAWEAYLEPIKHQDRKIVDQLMRFLHSTAIYAEPDSQGRVVLTPALLEYAGIGKEAVIVGCADYAEIWAADKYDAEMNTVNPEELRSALEALGCEPDRYRNVIAGERNFFT